MNSKELLFLILDVKLLQTIIYKDSELSPIVCKLASLYPLALQVLGRGGDI